jgi:hypothetical protein
MKVEYLYRLHSTFLVQFQMGLNLTQREPEEDTQRGPERNKRGIDIF